MTLLGKVVEAIEKKVSEAQPIYDWDSAEIARAALEAIREPDQPTLDAGCDEAQWFIGDFDHNDMKASFTAMIDHILGKTE